MSASFFPLLYALVMLASIIVVMRKASFPTALRRQNRLVYAIVAAWLLALIVVIFLLARAPDLNGWTIAEMLLLILLGIIGLVVVLRAITIPHLTPRPPAGQILHGNRDRVKKFLKPFFLTTACTLIPCLLVPGVYRYMALTMVATLVLIVGLTFLAAYIAARDADRALSALEYTSWLHWQIPPTLWSQWVDAEVARVVARPPSFSWKRDWLTVAITFAAAPLVGWLYAMPPLAILGVSAGIAAMILVFIAIGRRQQQDASAARRAQLAKATPEVFFGPDGYSCAGVFTAWLAADCFLTSAAISNGPPTELSLYFRRTVLTGNTYELRDALQTVPIPPDPHLADLQQHLTTLCPEASITLTWPSAIS